MTPPACNYQLVKCDVTRSGFRVQSLYSNVLGDLWNGYNKCLKRELILSKITIAIHFLCLTSDGRKVIHFFKRNYYNFGICDAVSPEIVVCTKTLYKINFNEWYELKVIINKLFLNSNEWRLGPEISITYVTNTSPLNKQK